MLLLLRSLAFCIWCAVLFHHRAVADEEAPWGRTPHRETSSWWPKPPYLPSFPFRNPFYGSSDDDRDAAALLTTTKGPNVTINTHLFLTPKSSSNHPGNITDHMLDPSGSGDGSSLDASETSDIHGNTRTESLPTGTSDFPHGNNGSLVPDSYTPTSTSVRNTLFTDIPTSTSSPRQHATHTHPPWGTTQAAGSSMGAVPQHLPGDITQQTYSTVPPETTVPTALTWMEGHTTTIPGLVDGPPIGHPSSGPVTPRKSPQTTFVVTSEYSIITDATVTEIYTPQGVSDPSVPEATPGQKEEQTGVITISTGINPKPALESLPSTTPSQRVKVLIASGKQNKKAASSFCIQSIDVINH